MTLEWKYTWSLLTNPTLVDFSTLVGSPSRLGVGSPTYRRPIYLYLPLPLGESGYLLRAGLLWWTPSPSGRSIDTWRPPVNRLSNTYPHFRRGVRHVRPWKMTNRVCVPRIKGRPVGSPLLKKIRCVSTDFTNVVGHRTWRKRRDTLDGPEGQGKCRVGGHGVGVSGWTTGGMYGRRDCEKDGVSIGTDESKGGFTPTVWYIEGSRDGLSSSTLKSFSQNNSISLIYYFK